MSDKQAPIRVGFYDIEKTIGKGNFAVVKLARHRLTKTEVAIKIIDKTQLQAADLRRAYREVRVLKKLHHPHIIRLYQVMETKNMLYIVTEYAPQGEVFEHIARHGRLPEPSARRLYWQVVSAVEYCHCRSVVHRDLKAENLLLDGEGTVKLADFGFSTWWSSEGLLSTWCGSPPYAAPEVFEGRQYTGPEVDIWSLGVVLYVLVCGALPFDAASLPALRDRVLSARYRVPYFMSADCESLVRKMLVRDPSRRYTIDQVKRHRWMQVDGPPRLLPAPGHSPSNFTANNTCHKQYLDPGLAPDVPSEPNEQILRLMASLGIDSLRTRESLRQQSYDHHAAIYYLLLERLRQHRPGGGHRFVASANSTSVPAHPPSAIRMLSNDSSTCRNRGTPRRPSTVAEQAMMKTGPINEVQSSAPPGQTQAGSSRMPNQDHNFWKTHRTSQGSGPSQTSSVDEGVADMDSGWDPEGSNRMDSNGVAHGSSASSGVPNTTSSSAVRSRTDWKWPARGSTGSSIQISSDLSQGSGSPRESMSSSGTTLSSWDSFGLGLAAASLPAMTLSSSSSVTSVANELPGIEGHHGGHAGYSHAGGHSSNSRRGFPGGTLPSCTQSQSAANEERRSSITGSETPLSPGPCLTADRLWTPATRPPGSPTEFRLGRRASDGLVGRIVPFPNKLEVARAGGVAGIAAIAEKDRPSNAIEPLSYEEGGCVGDNTFEPQLNLASQCSPAKRPSLPDAWKLIPDWSTAATKDGSSSAYNEGGGTSAHLYRQLMSLRLQRRAGVVEQPDLSNLSEARANARKSVLRQQSYKLAQQQPVLPPLDGGMEGWRPRDQSGHSSQQGILGLDSCVFRSISQEESNRLHAHEEEDEEDAEAERSNIWPANNDMVLGLLPVTMGDCKLTDSNSSLRLSPLLRLSHFHSPSSSPIPFPWEQSSTTGGTTAHHLPQPSDIIPQRQERMDTSANNVN